MESHWRLKQGDTALDNSSSIQIEGRKNKSRKGWRPGWQEAHRNQAGLGQGKHHRAVRMEKEKLPERAAVRADGLGREEGWNKEKQKQPRWTKEL